MLNFLALNLVLYILLGPWLEDQLLGVERTILHNFYLFIAYDWLDCGIRVMVNKLVYAFLRHFHLLLLLPRVLRRLLVVAVLLLLLSARDIRVGRGVNRVVGGRFGVLALLREDLESSQLM